MGQAGEEVRQGSSITERLNISRGEYSDYERLSGFHYRSGKIRIYTDIFKGQVVRAGRLITCGVIVYTMPVANIELRNIATGGVFGGLGRGDGMRLVNEHIRCISRVIVEPRFRGVGVGCELVRQTMQVVGGSIVESLSVMGRFNGFFERAGMKRYEKPVDVRVERVGQALETVGIEEGELIDPVGVYGKLQGLGESDKAFIDKEIKKFLQAYGRRRQMGDSVERVRYVLGKLGDRPVYYIWVREGARVGFGAGEKAVLKGEGE